LIKGFPQSSEQLKIFISKGATIGCLAGIFIELKGSVYIFSNLVRPNPPKKRLKLSWKITNKCKSYWVILVKNIWKWLKNQHINNWKHLQIQYDSYLHYAINY